MSILNQIMVIDMCQQAGISKDFHTPKYFVSNKKVKLFLSCDSSKTVDQAFIDGREFSHPGDVSSLNVTNLMLKSHFHALIVKIGILCIFLSTVWFASLSGFHHSPKRSVVHGIILLMCVGCRGYIILTFSDTSEPCDN